MIDRKKIDFERLNRAIKEEMEGTRTTRPWRNDKGEVRYVDSKHWGHGSFQTYDKATKSWVAKPGFEREFEELKGFSPIVYNYKPYIPYGGESPWRMTKLCALKAHARGKLHISRKRVPTYAGVGGGGQTIDCTLEQQEEFIQDVLQEFLLPEQSQQPSS